MTKFSQVLQAATTSRSQIDTSYHQKVAARRQELADLAGQADFELDMRRRHNKAKKAQITV